MKCRRRRSIQLQQCSHALHVMSTLSASRHYRVPLPALRAHAHLPCAGSHHDLHGFLSLGANWCNTLALWKSVPEVRNLTWVAAARPWTIVAFEAAPKIVPHVEKCVQAIRSGSKLPQPPVVPAGSTSSLLKYSSVLGCNSSTRGWFKEKKCIMRKSKAIPTVLMSLLP